MIVIGIDPGITGAVAILTPNNVVTLYDTPTIEVKKAGGKKRTEFLPAEMASILAPYTTDAHVFIEQVTAMPKQGVSSTFGFGKGFGIWIGILSALKIPHTFVLPAAWKKTMMEGIHDKDASRLVAQQRFPRVTEQLSRKKDVGRSDALLIAAYGSLQMNAVQKRRVKK